MRNVIYIILGVIVFSCHPFYKFSNPSKESDLYRVYDMKIGKDTVNFNAYFDYYHDTINLATVYLHPKEFREIKKSISTLKNGKQILFLHDEDEKYLNVIGYFYKDLYIKEIHPPKNVKVQELAVTQGRAYHYIKNENPISEFFIPYNLGILRFIAIGDLNVYKTHPERFYKEIDFVFFVANSNLFKLKPEIEIPE